MGKEDIIIETLQDLRHVCQKLANAILHPDYPKIIEDVEGIKSILNIVHERLEVNRKNEEEFIKNQQWNEKIAKGLDLYTPTELTISEKARLYADLNIVHERLEVNRKNEEEFIKNQQWNEKIAKGLDLYTPTELTISEKARLYAERVDKETNHIYAEHYPYSTHYDMTCDIARRFIYLIPEEHRLNVWAACRCHDVIDDCRQNYDDVASETNVYIAELVYAVSNEKGRNRKERANDKYYGGIRNTNYAVFVKLCDRMANIEFSHQTDNTKKLKMYADENENFRKQLFLSKYSPMFDFMEELLNQKERIKTV